MSKMPGKKKSCFQITSVTPAQVGASNVPDDTESLEDPDEPRTEDVSSEMFEVSRVDAGVCDRSSLEETLNNVGDSQECQLPNTVPVNGGLSIKSTLSGSVAPHHVGGSVPVPATAQPFVPSSNTTVSTSVAHTAPSTSCSSRFRVIKLDHGIGEPYRRGRWTCTEFYERDSDSNVNRTVDSIKPTVTHDHSIDRDSGLGATSNSVVTSSTFPAQVSESTADSGYSPSIGHPGHSHPPESQQKGYSLSPQIGSGASAFQPMGSSASQPPEQAQVNMQHSSQTFHPNSLNGVHQGAIQQKSSVVPPAMQAQQFVYSAHPTGLSSGHPDYHQQHFGSGTQNFSITSSSMGPSVSQVSSPQITPAGSGTQGLGGEVASAQGIILQVGNAPVMTLIHPESTQQHPVSQSQPSGGLGIAPAPSMTTTPHSGGQNVPATVPSTTNIPPGISSQAPGTGGPVQLQGAHGGATEGLPFGFGNEAEDGRLKSDALPQHSAGVVHSKDGIKPAISEDLSLPSPVNSLFGIEITMDMDEDSASGASVVAIDNKIEQAMDLVKSHLMYAVREEVEVLKEQIKELYERNSVLERENAVLKSLANSEQLNQLTNQLCSTSPPLQQHPHPLVTNNTPSLVHHESQSIPHQPNITSA
ncbi:TSC22 domain family protein 2 [Melanotaenia boesemani]|uniref:TSC22 domain family protein 2 n=1 Tax=Melanotaenia boesemani TaxID=1250792 RepID=UPI001C057AF6|nr:TSC22 domain family protein 2 [Melanotaenia boesemani]